jgi:hypothetical protein
MPRAVPLQPHQEARQALDPELMSAIRLVVSSPAIRGEYLKVDAEMQEALAAAIAERAGADPGADMGRRFSPERSPRRRGSPWGAGFAPTRRSRCCP